MLHPHFVTITAISDLIAFVSECAANKEWTMPATLLCVALCEKIC